MQIKKHVYKKIITILVPINEEGNELNTASKDDYLGIFKKCHKDLKIFRKKNNNYLVSNILL